MRSSASRRSKILRALSDDLSFDLVGHLAMFGKARTRDLAATLGVASTDITKRIKPLEEAGLVSRGTPNHTLVIPAQTVRLLRESDRLEIGVVDLERARAHRKFAARENMLRGMPTEDRSGAMAMTRLHWQHTDEAGTVVLAADEGILVGDGDPSDLWANLDYLPFLALVAGMSASGELSPEWALIAAQRTVVSLTPHVGAEAGLSASRYPALYDASDAVFATPRLIEEATSSYHWARARDPERHRRPRMRPAISNEDVDPTAAPLSPFHKAQLAEDALRSLSQISRVGAARPADR